ncbi:hypothetical protein [Parasitella parasitica]|uniref:Uncharacterized protein n=1 Tax=Parasitella parasitica TaxID=35722 RepID=A0A0B7NDB0_9FUNG|nr:hypothetical protein [Parasitella parasitica]
MNKLQTKIEHINNVVFLSIKERTKNLTEEYSKKLEKRRMIIKDIPFDSAFIIRSPEGRQSKLFHLYAGHNIVVRRTMAGNYILKDETNESQHCEYTPFKLKLVSIDETEIYVVEEIRDHRKRTDGGIE